MAASELPVPNPKHPINPTLIIERQKATFDPNIITTHLFDNSSLSQTKRRRYLQQLIQNDPSGVFDNSMNPFLHRKERHVRALAKVVRLVELGRSIGMGVGDSNNDNHINGELILDKNWMTFTEATGDDLPASLHWQMFVPNILSLADAEQQREWLKLCRDWKMIGCYAQTELGHGSNVRGIETTATFVKGVGVGQGGSGGRGRGRGGVGDDNGDNDNDNDGHWIIHSPTLTSLKFWPGTLGRTGNHAMVIARLIDGTGIDRGVHNFLVQTRSYENHKLMPGVITGDIGPKIGYNNADNGFAKFDHVKIPRRNMLMRFAHVDRDGVYTKKIVSDAAAKVNYVTMMQVRSWIVLEASRCLRMGVTIAIRYSAVRKQGFKHENTGKSTGTNTNTNQKEENQIIDYKQQQYRLFPLLAASYCFFFTGRKVMNDLKVIEKQLMLLTSASSKSTSSAITKTEVGDIHATTSSLKSFTTTITADGLEDCRKSCGGHGFLASSGLPEKSTTYLVHPTVEGDNHMLPMQVVKVLLKLVKDVQTDYEKAVRDWERCEARYLVKPVKAILDGAEFDNKCGATSEDDFMDVNLCLRAYQHRSARLLVEVANQIQEDMMVGGKSFEDAWNGALIQMQRVSRAHSLYLLLNNFVHGINEGRRSMLGPNEVGVLKDLALLFGLYWIEKEDGEFLADGYLSAKQIKWIRSCVLTMLDKIRPNAVALVDANDFPDFILQSTLGRYDGNVYEAILKESKKDPLNATEPGPGYAQHLKRLIVDGVGVYSGTVSRL